MDHSGENSPSSPGRHMTIRPIRVEPGLEALQHVSGLQTTSRKAFDETARHMLVEEA